MNLIKKDQVNQNYPMILNPDWRGVTQFLD